MKDKIKSVLTTIGIILIIGFAILWYPWFVSVENGETRCHNLLGVTMSCR